MTLRVATRRQIRFSVTYDSVNPSRSWFICYASRLWFNCHSSPSRLTYPVTTLSRCVGVQSFVVTSRCPVAVARVMW